jgi:hypothetical protein
MLQVFECCLSVDNSIFLVDIGIYYVMNKFLSNYVNLEKYGELFLKQTTVAASGDKAFIILTEIKH